MALLVGVIPKGRTDEVICAMLSLDPEIFVSEYLQSDPECCDEIETAKTSERMH